VCQSLFCSLERLFERDVISPYSFDKTLDDVENKVQTFLNEVSQLISLSSVL
jgi:hypothetical protein